jgi:NAD(P)-dependent dehydrogenase (short-subunit alcohol dehydrogenase family)
MASRVVLITGGAGGIGSATARILVARGDRVVLFGRREEPLQTLATELRDSAIAFSGDATRLEELEAAVERAVDAFGSLDGTAHCVGSIQLKSLHLTSIDAFVETLETNLISAFLACKASLGVMRKQNRGSIVLLSTAAVRQGMNNHEIIAAAKGGIEGLVRSAAMTYARYGVRFNCVAPGLTETPLAEPLLRSDANRAVSESLHPLGRVGRAEEVAGVIAYLLGDDAAWITGQTWGVDGGLAAGIAPPRIVRSTT